MTSRLAAPRWRSRRAGVALVTVVVVLVALLWLWPEIVRRALERYFTAALSTPVAIERADVSWWRLAARLEGVRVASLLPGAAAPLLTASTVTVNFAKLDDVIGAAELRLDALVVEGAELTSESIDGGPSSVADFQERLGRSAKAAAAGDGPYRLEVDRFVARDLTLRAVARGSRRTEASRLTFAELVLDRAAIPLDAAGGVPELRAAAVRDARVALEEGDDDVSATLERARTELSVAASPDVPDELAIGVSAFEASGVAVESSSEDDEPVGLRHLIEVWRAAVRGLRVPGVASLAVERADVRGASYTQRDRSGRPPLTIADVDATLEHLEHPQPQAGSGRLTATARPLAKEASLEVRASGALGEPGGPRPVEISARFESLPLAPFHDLHLESGTTTGRADMTIAAGRARGEASFRLFHLTAAPDAPATLRAAYASLGAVAGDATPELRLPFSFELRDPHLGELAGGIAAALAVELARSGVESLTATTRRMGEAAGAALDDAEQRVRRGVGEIFR